MIYQGDFLNGKFHGDGKLFYINGDILEGRFINGEDKG